MAQYGDYIPRKDGDFLAWAENLLTVSTAKKAAWEIPDAELAALETARAAYHAAYTDAKSPAHNAVQVQLKNSTRKTLEAALRYFVNVRLRYSHAVTDEDRRALALPVRDTVRTPVPPPATHPDFDIDTSELRQLSVRFWDAGSMHRGKPAGVHGAEIRWDYHEGHPASVDELEKSEFETRSPHTLRFDEGDRGKRVYICVRWENSKGEKGPWGEIVEAVIP